jgi:NhaA family Na+:H+ antiporter
MNLRQQKLSDAFKDFFESEKSSGILLIICTATSLSIANSSLGERYLSFWQMHLGGLSIEHWVNEALMAVFFLLVGLELERELYIGELSNLKDALLPIFAAIGGMLTPALIHY